jgi:tetratricopeptide (TPR) repeat protein
MLVSIGLVGEAAAQAEAQSTSETWYVLRGHANMKIGSYKAAIEAFEKATELNPDNRDAMRELGIAYEKQGLTAKAIEQFDRYLERFEDDPEIAFKQADYLSWDRYAYRRDDAIRYYRMGLAEQEDRKRRHALARLLAQDRDQLDDALEQYRILLEAEPDNGVWRAEYRDLLLWDPEHLAEAVQEYRRLAREKPDDFEVRHTLARLVARQNPRGREAIEVYADLVALQPGNAALRLEYAQVLARHTGKREEAIEQYRLVLERSASFDTREEYADLLSGREANRSKALEQYAILVRKRPDDVPLRLKYARLLGARREDTELAIAQYDAVLDRDPWNPTAHDGLARSYAWLGDRDRALRHANLAVRHGARGGDVAELRKDLLRGREPRLEPIFRGLVQRGRSKSELNGLGFGLRGQFDPSPFATLELEAGFEDYWRSGDNTAGGFVRAAAEFRLDPVQRLDFEIGYHSLGSGSGRNVLAKTQYIHDGETLELRGGFERSLRFDSYAALVGDRVSGIDIGAARENRFYGYLEADLGRLDLTLEPYAGLVDAEAVDDNPFVGLRGRLDYSLHESNRWKLSGVLGMEIYHYRDDAFGVDPLESTPLPGGYFSPQFFFEAVPGISTSIQWGENCFLDVEGGPALQVVNESGGGADFNVGGHAHLSFLMFIRDSMFWTFETGFVQISDAYTRVDWRTSLTFKF